MKTKKNWRKPKLIVLGDLSYITNRIAALQARITVLQSTKLESPSSVDEEVIQEYNDQLSWYQKQYSIFLKFNAHAN